MTKTDKQFEKWWEDNAMDLRQDLLVDKEFRHSYAESFLNTRLAAQIKALREQRNLTQKQLGEAIGTKQAGISRLENVNYSSWKTETLRRLARAFDTRLVISFEPFGSLLDEVEGFSRDALERPMPSPVKLPLEPKDALRALLQVKPPEKDDNPKADKKAAKGTKRSGG